MTHRFDPPLVSVVIPTYNGAGTLRQLVTGIHEAFRPSGWSYEIILVDDGSSDGSWQVLQELARAGEITQGIRLTRNFGQTGATMAGVRTAQGEIVITMDDDLQHPPAEAVRLVEILQKDTAIDAVIGVPQRKQHNLFRRLASAAVNRVSNMLFSKQRDFQLTSFRAIRRRLITPLEQLNVPSPPIGALLCTLSNNIKNVTVEHRPSGVRRSRYSLTRLVALTITKLVGFSIAPLRLMAVAGFFGFLASLLWSLILIVKYLTARIQVPGWMTIALMLAIIASALFMGFGIVGEYLYQILISTRNTPQFAVQHRHANPAPFGSQPDDAAVLQDRRDA